MTAQEALNTLILKTSCLNDTCANLDDCLKDGKCVFIVEGCNDCEDYKIAKALQKLVDRATPKKPVLYELFNEDENDYIFDEEGNLKDSYVCCPNCKKQDIYDFEYSVRFKHCSNCGQALDWSKEDENT